MKFAIKFYKGCRVLENADEIIIKYTKKTSKLIDFVQEWESHRIIVDVTELDNIEDNYSVEYCFISPHWVWNFLP